MDTTIRQWIYNLAGSDIAEMCDPDLDVNRYGELVSSVCVKTGLAWPVIYDALQGAMRTH